MGKLSLGDILMKPNRLFSLRETMELTQDDMAKILGVNRVSISNWENNKEIIPLEKLNIYGTYFNVSLDYILGISNIKNNGEKNIILDKKKIGANILRFRKEHHITQEELAHKLNTTHSTISAYENGKTLILTVFLYEIATTYNLSIDQLIGRKE